MLRILVLIHQAMLHTLTLRMPMPGFKGHRARQMTQELEILEDQELEYLQEQIVDQLNQRRMAELDSFTVISGGSGRHNKVAPQTPPRNTKKGMPVVSPMTLRLGEIPQCRCQLPSTILPGLSRNSLVLD